MDDLVLEFAGELGWEGSTGALYLRLCAVHPDMEEDLRDASRGDEVAYLIARVRCGLSARFHRGRRTR